MGALKRAQGGLATMLQRARTGVTFAELASAARSHLLPYRAHPLVARSIGNSIGLSLEEPCDSVLEENATIQEGGVYTLRCGAMGDGCDSAIVSSMIRVGEQRIEALWPTRGGSNENG
jgi:hypothetical protein